MRNTVTLSVQKLNDLNETDPAKLFFEAAETFFHPAAAMISTERSIKEALKASTLLEDMPIPELLIYDGLLNPYQTFMIHSNQKSRSGMI